MSHGRLEGQITIPSGGYAISVAITAIAGSPFTVTIPAGTYYPTDLLTTFNTLLDAATGLDGAWTVSASLGESGTGLVTIAHATQTFTITWTSTVPRDILGFTGTLTPAALTFTGTAQLRGVWLPNAEGAFTYGNGDQGHIESDIGSTESPQGDVKGIGWTTRTVLPSALWSHVPKAFAKIYSETTVGASFEQWWSWTQAGTVAYFELMAPVRLYWSADVASYKTYRFARSSTEMPRVDESWDGLFRVELTRLVRVPGT